MRYDYGLWALVPQAVSVELVLAAVGTLVVLRPTAWRVQRRIAG